MIGQVISLTFAVLGAAAVGSVPADARALQARWDSVIVVRVLG